MSEMKNSPPYLTVINGAGPSNFEAEVARLLEHPDGKAAWEELKRLRRRVIPAANSTLASVESCDPGPASEPGTTDRP
jgi:hypothetical protein